MNLDYQNPQSIYESVRHQVEGLLQKLIQLEHSNLQMEQERTHVEQSLQIINEVKQNIDDSIQKLEHNADWDTLQIAFFGETNAGKSTIIETLRILLSEPTKIKQQQQFHELTKSLDISAKKVYQVQDEMANINHILDDLIQQKSNIEQKYTNELAMLIQQEEALSQEWELHMQNVTEQCQSNLMKHQEKSQQLKRKIEKIKNDMSWFLKIIYFFIQLDEQKELVKLLHNIDALKYDMKEQLSSLKHKKADEFMAIAQKKKAIIRQQNTELTSIEQDIQPHQNQLQNLQQWCEHFNAKKAQLLPYLDGQIIGDGRSDFTQGSTSYQFNINQYPVAIIDVPGIEGNEQIVQNEINKAVQKTHVVFYVTSKDAPPNEGTLMRIQQYLNDQTEVWAIYNKQITNPRQLNRDLVQNEDEQKSLNDLEEKLKETLGQHYCGLIILAGLPAFFSHATCIEPFSHMYEKQKKFIDKIGRDDLYKLSQLEIVNQKLQHQIVGDVPSKIRKSNLNKVKVVIENSTQNLIMIHQIYKDFESDLMKRIQLAQQSVRGYFNDFDMQVRSQANSLVNNFVQKIRHQIYAKIDVDISNHVFKSSFNDIIKFELEIFERDIKDMITKFSQSLEENITKTQNELLRQIKKLNNEYQQYTNIRNVNMRLNFHFDNGINIGGLISAIITGALVVIFPPTVLPILIITGIVFVIQVVKSVWGFFSTEHKKEQQRKNVNSNLPKMTANLKFEVNQKLRDLSKTMSENQTKILNDIYQISQPIKLLNQDLKDSILELEKISSQINVY